MRLYSDRIIEEIKREVTLIWAAHMLHKMSGQMRLYTPRNQQIWKSHEAGFEFWFGPKDIPKAMEKLEFFYRSGTLPNTPLFLDPIVYRIEPGQRPKPVGSGVIWASALGNDETEISSQTYERLRGIGAFCGDIHHKMSEGAGLKILAFAREPQLPQDAVYQPDSSNVAGCQELADLAGINSDAEYAMHYMLSGLEYRMSHGTYQHPKFSDIFDGKVISSARDIQGFAAPIARMKDAAHCWNAYERSEILYERYGVDVTNLELNLKNLLESERGLEGVRHELAMICQANKRHKLRGEMRLYSAPSQDRWRSKDAGVEIWFDEDGLDEAMSHMQVYYNAGILPNTPLLLDPIIYERTEDGNRAPIGTAVAFATALCTGNQEFDVQSLDRLREAGAMIGLFTRAGSSISGVKIVTFLEKPYIFTPQERDMITTMRTQERDDAPPQFETHDAVPYSASNTLFAIVNSNGEDYAPYYPLNGMDYLCVHGSYSCKGFIELPDMSGMDAYEREDALSKMVEEINREPGLSRYIAPDALESTLRKHSSSLQKLEDIRKCWDAYDRHHVLWRRFGVDTANLEDNLRYYNLCARDFRLLDATGNERKDKDDKFEFFVPGWIPRAAVTVIGATGGTGKSSLAHRLAIMASIDWQEGEEAPLWLGSPIDTTSARGLAIYFSGEDSAAIVNARAKMIDPEGRSSRLMLQRTDFGTNSLGQKAGLADFLEYLRKLPEVSIVVIDPARKYLTGDEDDSSAVSDFFEAIEEFAIEKNCAMLVVHHLAKKAHPENTFEIIDLLRGSQVFIDRPRVVIGMMRDGAYTVAGLAKNNIPPNLGMVEGERVFVRDPDRLDLLWLPGDEGVRRYDVSAQELAQIRSKVISEKL